MEAQELRINNFISFGDSICKVVEIQKGCFYFEDEEGEELKSTTCEYSPILLTEEWHNNFGVVKSGFNQFEYNSPRKNNFNVDILFTGDYVYIRQRTLSSRPSHNDDLISIWNKDLTKRDMYVHEWQNLYYSLTGEELTIKNQE